ncbi:hypothetical protein N7478_006149 [Penicillium angulare]|uniref:uncharacterized protein n=1 Tax=Penicillium angulare TaxID=116970 RepID=UPI00254245B0|nr:uncharacterized protein N7478_006149 [Penicillium angulare]KAJ5280777.1 hypothetical protein N7478_006149 [Penicillium angulare]
MALLAGPGILMYGGHEARGLQRERWMENIPGQPPCPVQPTTLTLAEYGPQRTFIAEIPLDFNLIPEDFATAYVRFGLGNCPIVRGIRVETGGPWLGCLAPGHMILEGIYRTLGGPYVSDVSNMFYTECKYLEDLRYVFVATVENTDTKEFLESDIYTAANGLAWPPVLGGHHRLDLYYDRNPAELQAILGTEIGKMVCAIVLGRWPPGTHRIPHVSIAVDEIVVSIDPQFGTPEMRAIIVNMMFSIEEIPVAAPAAAGGDGDGDRGDRGDRDASPGPSPGQKRAWANDPDYETHGEDNSKSDSSDPKSKKKRTACGGAAAASPGRGRGHRRGNRRGRARAG